ncbi:MAG TPA: hypothetical protein VN931_08025 [Fibrobacteria bacterium]|nr:hypothetical protein [Fibrobacteria bacterium]
MSLSDFIKENVYLPYFHRHSARARSQQVLLGVAIGAFVIAGMVGWWLWSRRGGRATSLDGVRPSGA